MFSYKTAFQAGIKSFKNDWYIWLVIGLATSIFTIPDIIIQQKSNAFSGINWWWQMPSLLILAIFTPSFNRLALNAVRGKKLSFATLFQYFRFVLPLLGYTIISLIMALIGSLALLIPGLYLFARYLLGGFAIVDSEKLGVFNALQRSSELTKGNILNIIGLLLFIGLIMTIAGIGLVSLIYLITASNLVASVIGQYLGSAVVGWFYYGFATVAVASVYVQLLETTSVEKTG